MGFSTQHLLLVLLVIVVLFGAGKLPQIGKGMGEAIRNFKRSVNDNDDVTDITPINAKKENVVENQENTGEKKNV